MTKKPFFIRIDQDVIDLIEKLCKKHSISKAELIENAVKKYVQNELNIDKNELKQLSWSKPLPLKFPNKYCIKCKRKLEIGELVLITKSSNGYQYLCYECFLKLNKFKNKDYKEMLNNYIKIKRLKALINEAEKRLNKLISKINLYDATEFLLKQIESIRVIINDISSYMYSIKQDKNLSEIKNELEKLNEQLEQYLALMRKTILKAKEVKVYG